MREMSDRDVRIFLERRVEDMLEFCFERDGCYLLKWEITLLIHKYVTSFTTVANMICDEIMQ